MSMTSSDDELDGAIAIIGMGLRVPGADTPDAFWRNLRDGVCSIARFTPDELRAAGVPEAEFTRPDYVPAGGVLEGIDRFDAGFFGFTAREAECLAPQNRLLFECCWEALEQAGYDPKGTPGRTGLFFGQSVDSYWRNNVAPNLTALDVGLDFFANPDFLSTGIAYKLDLRGPALTVQSFCSTSLLAVHLARQSLLEGECDMALAGGASVRVPQTQGYRHMPDSLYSADGVVRAFDAGANGTLFSNGVGAVLLKRLEDALADGDRIDAVIRGSAANNDGNRKAGYNAPSVDGQARVVVQALRDAGVPADSIGYVECHGTGTLLGDPIEIAALTKAFRVFTGRRGYCAVGSAKPNIGHADRASGVVGLIKAALSLRHRTLPGLPNFRSPNPRIDFADSPFHVNDRTRAWEAADGPRRAGVTSLGYGGTNVHLVLEEAPERPRPAEAAHPHGARPHPILLSARTPAALDAVAARLAGHLERHPGEPLAAVARTLQTGRHGFNHRRLVVGGSTAEVARRLRDAAPDSTATATRRNPPVHFVFSEAPLDRAAARAAYASDPTLRRLLDEGRALPFGDILDGLPDAAARLLFDQALARCLIAWGIAPASLRADGAARLAAGCVAGIVEPEEALTRLAGRGDLPAGRPDGLPLLAPADALDPADLRLAIELPGGADGDGGLARMLGGLWLAGVEPDWSAVHDGAVAHRLALPTYPFERERHWLDAQSEMARSEGSVADEAFPTPPVAEPATTAEPPPACLVPSWRRLPPRMPADGGACCRIVVLDRAGLGERLADALEAQGDTVIRIAAGEQTTNPAERRYTVDAGRPEQLDRLLTRLKIWEPAALILCADPAGTDVAGQALAGFLDLHRWIRAVDGVWPDKPFAIHAVASGLFQVTGADAVRPELATLPALAAVAAQEHRRRTFRVLDAGPGVTAGALAAELRLPPGDGAPAQIALRGGQRWAPASEPMPLEAETLAGMLRPGGVYLITGGLGGIGHTLAAHLARTVAAKLVLLSRGVPAPNEPGDKARRLEALRAQGAEVLALAADAAEPAQIAQAVAQARARFGRIDGVIHAAGLPGATTLDALDAGQVRAVMAPKVAGACALIDALRDDPPDFLVLCSSLAAVAPTVGQGHYAAANAVLDALAQRPDNPMPVIAVNWNSWRTVGMAQDVWNRQAETAALDHPLFAERTRMPDGEIRYRARLDPERDWRLSEHRLFGRPTLPGTGVVELALAAFQHDRAEGDGFRPVELRDVALVRPWAPKANGGAVLRVSLIPDAEGTAFRVESVAPDTAPLLHGQGTLHPLAGVAPPTAVGQAARPYPLPDQAPADLELGPRWRSLTRVSGDEGSGARSVAELSLDDRFHGDLAATPLHPALLDIATSVHGHLRAPDSLHLPVGYRRLRVFRPLGAHLVSVARPSAGPAGAGTLRWDLAIADREGRTLAEIDGYTLAAPSAEPATPPTAVTRDGLHGNPFEADSITPEEGVALFRRLPVGIAPQLLVSRARTAAGTAAGTAVAPAAPAPTGGPATATVDVRTALTGLWQRILGGPPPAPDASFFELGGNSLGATRILSHIRETYGVTLEIRAFFAGPTIEALARRIEDAAAPAPAGGDADEDREEGTL
ncbi:acyl transferase domain-containing protein/acyl carrier protein [Azospirillum agricola]|uniref:SDR family NAD(P)-dependent oxidoreductase n=1 Tax=Azospirillum agricola TaxID=1720247 RepID=UPI001AE8205A|nr:SDR family NAD(P)-dependent oxidoreductase [Azospirillum agricola]MBP2229005.1 acyl transferase domain-containing protein/acyl carrier protein [Azospirillum agricola]